VLRQAIFQKSKSLCPIGSRARNVEWQLLFLIISSSTTLFTARISRINKQSCSIFTLHYWVWEEKERKISHERKKKQIAVKTTLYFSAPPPPPFKEIPKNLTDLFILAKLIFREKTAALVLQRASIKKKRCATLQCSIFYSRKWCNTQSRYIWLVRFCGECTPHWLCKCKDIKIVHAFQQCLICKTINIVLLGESQR
jgi:hypothetical protein